VLAARPSLLVSRVYTRGGLIWDAPLIIFTISNMLLFLPCTIPSRRNALMRGCDNLPPETGLCHHTQNYPSTPPLYSFHGTVHLTLNVKSLSAAYGGPSDPQFGIGSHIVRPLGYKREVNQPFTFTKKGFCAEKMPKCEAGATRSRSSRLMTMTIPSTSQMLLFDTSCLTFSTQR